MKKILTLAFLSLFIGFSLNAQTPSKAATTVPAEKSKALAKSWTFAGSENFSLEQAPTEAQKNDVLMLMTDGRFRWIYNGNPVVGTWTADKSNTMISLTQDVTNEVFKIKVLHLASDRMKVDYRDKDDVHNILIYTSK